MEIRLGNMVIPIYAKRQKVDNQIIRSGKDGEYRFRIILSNDLTIGSTKPLVSITNQLTKITGGQVTGVKDYFKSDMIIERVLTIKI